MSFKLSTLSVTKIILWLALATVLTLLSAPLMAKTETLRQSTSISYTQNLNLNKAGRDSQLKQVEADVLPALNQQGYRIESTAKALHINSSSTHYVTDFLVYDADVDLINDFNFDGFYHRFSLSVDVDTVYDAAYIYAKLYLSYEGGPWSLYATSDDFHIYADSESDRFIIETELTEGYPTGYYDIRIEVYDADQGGWLLSYGPYDNAALNTLPLQESYADDSAPISIPVESEIIIVSDVHGGAINWNLLGIMLLIPLLTRLRNK